jgi:hypothetical protein
MYILVLIARTKSDFFIKNAFALVTLSLQLKKHVILTNKKILYFYILN